MGQMRKPPRTPLAQAASFLDATHRLLKRIQRDSALPPQQENFALLMEIEDNCIRVRLLANHIEVALHQRLGIKPPPMDWNKGE
jgi:hypothetical protein